MKQPEPIDKTLNSLLHISITPTISPEHVTVTNVVNKFNTNQFTEGLKHSFSSFIPHFSIDFRYVYIFGGILLMFFVVWFWYNFLR